MTDGLAPTQHCDWCDRREFAGESDMIPVIDNVHICRGCAAELAFDNLQGHETITPTKRVLTVENAAGHNARPIHEGHDE